jgi:rhamnose utilization protein RhaD (predicted bifunctional aldolase and dehydrogenase)
MSFTPIPALAALNRLAASVGGDPELVQAAGGNVSLKCDGVMWIKASGTWLEHAKTRNIMVPLRLGPLLEAFTRGDPSAQDCVAFIDPALAPGQLRPSVETTMHAILPDNVVIHVHCVDTIAWAVRSYAEDVLAPLLDGLPWIFVPYRRPGLPLTQGIAGRLTPSTRVIVLGKHGLVVTGPIIEDAKALLDDVVARLRRPARLQPMADLAGLARFAEGTPYRPAAATAAHALALDAENLAVAALGSLYPDHVVFLGRGVLILEARESVTAGLIRITAEAAPPKLVLAPGEGAFVPRDSVAAVDPMVRCLADVTSRLRASDPIEPLTRQDEDALLNWDAEHYRQALARSASTARVDS